MAYQSSILSQVLKEVNRYDFKKQVSKHNGDYKVLKLNCFLREKPVDNWGCLNAIYGVGT